MQFFLLKLGMGKIYGFCHVLLVLQEHTIFKFKSSSGVQSLVSRYMPSIKMFLCFVAALGFCPNLRHFSWNNQSGDNEHLMMQMNWCLKPGAGGG